MHTMSAITTTAAPVATTAPKAPKPSKPVTPEQAKQITDQAEARKRGTFAEAVKAAKAAITADTRKLNALDKARAAMLDTRIEVVRATAYLMTFPESHAKAGKTAGKPSQSVLAEALGINRLTFAPFFKAASELYSKFPELETEAGRAITEDERIYVASFWKAEALRAKAVRDAAKAKAEAPKSGEVTTTGGEDGEDGDTAGAGAGKGTDGRTSEVTADTALACLKLLADALGKMAEQKIGFTAEQVDVMLEGLTSAGMAVEELKVASK